MRAFRALAAASVVTVAALAAACGRPSSTPTAPTPPPPSGIPGPGTPGGTPDPETPPEPPPPAPAPRLSRTRIVAFGDSLTEGVVRPSFALLVDVPGSYPRRLMSALAARYSDQTVEVLNEGRAGEWSTDGVDRFPDVVRQDNPELILLMEGANDLNFLGRDGISQTIGQLETMVKFARARNIPIMLANLPPQREGSRSGLSAEFLDEFNRQVRATAADEGAIFVDVAGGFGSGDGLIGPDGLHPTAEGYERLSQIFMDAIRLNFEAAPAATAAATP